MGAITDLATMTFNAVGVKDQLRSVIENIDQRAFNIVNFITNGDFVSTTYDQVGTNLYGTFNVTPWLVQTNSDPTLSHSVAEHMVPIMPELIIRPDGSTAPVTLSDYSSTTPDLGSQLLYDLRVALLGSGSYNFPGLVQYLDPVVLTAWIAANGLPTLDPANGTQGANDLLANPQQIIGTIRTTQGDLLVGTRGNDTISGLTGNDTLYAGAGNDNLNGGQGDDTYIFGAGWGQDEINESHTQDNVLIGADGNNTIQFGSGVPLSDLVSFRQGNDLVIADRNTLDRLTVDDYYVSGSHFSTNTGLTLPPATPTPSTLVGDSDISVYGFYSGDETVTNINTLSGVIGSDAQAIESSVLTNLVGDILVPGLRGSYSTTPENLILNGGADQITGTAYNIFGDNYLGQHDLPISLTSYGGNDIIRGNANSIIGDDEISVRFNTSIPNQLIKSVGGSDYIEMDTGDTTIIGDTSLFNQPIFNTADAYLHSQVIGGDDIISHNTGNATIYGDGVIQINNNADGEPGVVSASRIRADLQGGNDAIDAGSGNDIILGDGTVDDYSRTYNADTESNTYTLSYASLLGGNDLIVAGQGNDIVEGDGNLNLNWYRSGSDTFLLSNSTSYQGGNDVIEGDQGNDILIGDGATIAPSSSNSSVSWGNDLIDGGADNDLILGDGIVVTPSQLSNASSLPPIFNLEDPSQAVLDAALYKTLLANTGGNDTIIGGTGNDTLWGGGGNDEYRFNKGDGSDIISEGGANANLDGGTDTVVFGTGITSTGITVASSGTDLIIHYTNNDQLTIENQLNSVMKGRRVESFQFADGVTLTAQQLATKLASGDAQIVGDNTDNYLAGNSTYQDFQGLGGNDQIVAASLGDTLDGGEGDDTLDAGTGHDTLIGGVGNDSFVVNSSGVDIFENAGEGTDSLYLGYLTTDLTFQASGTNLQIMDGTQLIANVHDQLASDGYKVENFIFSDNSTLSASDIQALLPPTTPSDQTLNGTSGDDTLIGGDGNDTLDGSSGNDSLSGGVGNDLLIGWTGNDTLLGGDGNDTLNAGDGDDYLDGGSGDDVLHGDAGNDTLYGQEGNDSIDAGDGDDLVYGGSGNDSIIGYTGNDTLYGNEGDDTLDGGDGNDLLDGGSGNNVLYGRMGNDTLIGGDGADLLDAGEGDDSVLGGAGNDQIIGYSGNDSLYGQDGNDTMDGGDGADLLDGGSGDDLIYGRMDNDTLYGQDGNDTLDAGEGDDLVYGGTGNDSIIGYTGNDTLYGQEGNDSIDAGDGDDVINGGTGNDLLQGGAGNDTYQFALGDGQDVINDYSGTDQVVFDSSVSQSNVALFMTSGGDLQIGYANSAGDLITVQSQSNTGNAIEQFQLSNGNFMTAADINNVIAQMAAYAASNSVSFTSLSDVENNTNLMTLVNSGWHS